MHHHHRLAVSLALLAVASAPAAAQEGAQELAPRRALEKPARAELAPFHRTDAIAVKFRDGLPLRVGDGRLAGGESVLDAEARAVVERYASGRWHAVSPLPREHLDALRARAEANLGRRIADLGVDFVLLLPQGADARAALDAFNALDVVELARPVPLPAPEPWLVAPDLHAHQGYLGAATDGVDAPYAWDVLGTRGAGVRFGDVEYDANRDHDDFPAVTVLGGTPISPFGNDHHGTATMGEVIAQDDGVGTTGIAPDADAYFAATYPDFFVNVAGAVLECASAFDAGDVILIEAQTWGPLSDPFSGLQFGMVPVEWNFAEYTAIQMAVGLGITVVEAGANGSQDLDDPLYSTGNGGHWPFLPQNDSGAIVVGAGHAPAAFGGSDVDRSRRWYSSWGSRVDVQGWGERIWTTGYGDAWSVDGRDALYTSVFSGTSGASPIVAGACVLLQAAHRDRFGVPFTPLALRDLLIATGSPQQAGEFPASQSIGPRPDVRAAAFSAGLAPFQVFAGCAGNPLTLAPVSESAVLGAPLALDVVGAPAGDGVAWLFAGAEAFAPASCGAFVPGLGELLLGLAPPPVALTGAAVPAGPWSIVLPVPAAPDLAGLELRLQAARADPSALGLSNGLRVRFGV